MNKVFESKVFKSIERVGEKVGANLAINSIQGALMGSMGLIMTGAFFQLLAVIPANFGLLSQESVLYVSMYGVYNLTMNLLSLWFIFQLGYNYSRILDLAPMTGALISTLNFLIVSTVGYRTLEMESLSTMFLGGPGLFIAILVGLTTVWIYNFTVKKKIVIKMPDVVPPFLAESFSGIIPLVLSTALWLFISVGVNALTGVTFPELFIGLISMPLSYLTGFWGMLILGALGGLLWGFGIHGTMMVYVAVMPVMLDAITSNAAAYQSGGIDALVYYPVLLFTYVQVAGGTGNTIGAALLGLRAKSEQLNAVAKAGIIPGIFNINEPITFGYPVMYNPIMVIPYILNIVVAMVIGHVAYKIGWNIPGYINIGSVMPIGVGEFLSTLSYHNTVTTLVIVVVTTLIWYPFMKVYDNQLYEKEQLEKETE